MIKLFPKIRQNLLKEGKTSRYFKYAVGEIILVVIGILIALQIDNWNETRIDTQHEITLLKNLQQDINLDKLDINFNIKYHKQMFKAELELLTFLQSDLTQPKTPIDYSTVLGLPLMSVLHKSTFNNLINNDIGIISNNDLKKSITRFYDYFVTSVLMLENQMNEYRTYADKKPFFFKYFKLDNNSKLVAFGSDNNEYQHNPNIERQNLVFKDIQGAKQDEAFKIQLNESQFFRNAKISNYTNLLTKIEELDALINKELKILEE